MSHGRSTTAIFHPATLSFKKPQSNGRRTDQAVGSGALLGGSNVRICGAPEQMTLYQKEGRSDAKMLRKQNVIIFTSRPNHSNTCFPSRAVGYLETTGSQERLILWHQNNE